MTEKEKEVQTCEFMIRILSQEHRVLAVFLNDARTHVPIEVDNCVQFRMKEIEYKKSQWQSAWMRLTNDSQCAYPKAYDGDR